LSELALNIIETDDSLINMRVRRSVTRTSHMVQSHIRKCRNA
jgi:hypothetical protein